jgi:GT2 family glycosyltransferase
MLAHPAVWDRRGVLLALEQHFDRMSAMLPTRSTSNDLAWHDHPDILHLALERQPLPLVLGSDSPITPAQPPELPGGLRTVASVLAETRGERSALPDPAAPLLAELGRTRVTLDDFRDGVVQVRALKASLASAEAGWAEAIEHVRSLDTSLATAEAGWSETAERVRSLEGSLVIAKSQVAALDVDRHGLGRSLDALESQLIKRPGCWLTEVSGPQVTGEPIWPDYDTQYQSWLATSGGDRPVVAASSGGPTFSILTPVFNPSAHLLEACIRSVRAQSYPHWELVLLDVSDAPHVAAICRRFSEVDPRIRVVKHSNGGISTNTNLAAAEASGDWFVLLDHDDELANHALVAVAQAIEERSDVSYVYSDEDKIDESGNRSDPFFKPDWSPDLLRTVNYVTHLQAIRRDLWERIGGLRMEYDGAQDYDLALRASWEAGGALHVPAILYHWRIHDQSTAGDVTVKPYAHRAGRRALEDFTLRHLSGVSVEFGTGPTSHRLRYPVSVQKLSVIIPFRDNWHFTEACLSGIARTGTGLPLEVLLVDNQSSDPMTLARIDDWTARYDWARVVRYDEPFNFQQLNNWAVSQSSGDLLLFLNNDVEPIHEGWVEALAEHAQRSEVGAVGARLFYPDGLVQHAGVAVGIGGYADHPWKGLHPDAWTPAGPSYWTRNFLAVTAACLMIERAKFEAVGGFNERFVVGGGDVDLGLRLVEAGFWNVMTPWARLIHHESVTRGTSVPESDLIESRRVYGPYLAGGDPFYNRNLSLDGTDPAVKEG